MTIIPQNPLSYTNRTFSTIYVELLTKFPNKPDWFIRLLAGLFDIAHWYIDARAQNLLLSSAYTDEAIRDLCAYLDYYPELTAAGGGSIEVVTSGTPPFIVSKNQLKFAITSPIDGTLLFEAVTDLSVTSGNFGNSPVLEGQTVTSNLGNSNGSSTFQQFIIPDTDALVDNLSIVVNGDTYTKQDTLANSSPTDKHFRVILKPKNILVVEFGDGVMGIIPPPFAVIATYRKGGGIKGNLRVRGDSVVAENVGTSDGVTAGQQFVLANQDAIRSTVSVVINNVSWTLKNDLTGSGPTDTHFYLLRVANGDLYVKFGNGTNGAIPGNYAVYVSYTRSNNVTVAYTGTDPNVVKAFPVDNFTGGKDKEDIEKSRKLAPMMLRSNYRAVTEEDYETLSKKFSASIVLAKCLPGYYGVGTVGMHIVPAGGGNPSSGLKTALESYLKARSTLNAADVRTRNPIYQAQSITAGIQMRSGYVFATYQLYATFACRLFVSEVATELSNIFLEFGIEAAVTFINAHWGYTFGSADYTELTQIIQKRIREGIGTWKTDLKVNDIIAALDDLTGVSTPAVTFPTTNVSLDFDKIFTEGTITVSQIP